MTNNTFNDGIVLQDSTGNVLFRNIIGGGPQGIDNGLNYWNSSTLGNYWTAYTSPDSNHDGIVDVPKSVTGGPSIDQFPLTAPVSTPFGLTAANGVGYVQLNWGGVNYSLRGDVDHYVLSRISSCGQLNITLGANVLSFNDTTVSNVESYTYYLVAVEGTNFSQPSGSILVVMPDHAPPQVTIHSPSDHAIINSTTMTVTWTGIHHGMDIDHYLISINGGTKNSATNGTWTFNGLTDGNYQVIVEVFTLGGNNASAMVNFTIDTTSPTLTILSPDDLSFKNTGVVMVSWTASDALSGIANFNYSIDGGTWTMVADTILSHEFSGLTDGHHVVSVIAIDKAGNEKKAFVNFTVDTITPILTIISPTEGSYLNSTSITVRWDSSDSGSGIANLLVKLDDGDWVCRDPTDFSAVFGPTSEGVHTLYVKVIDKASNMMVRMVNITVDISCPTITAFSPTGATVAVDANVSISFSEAMNTSSVSMFIAGVTGHLEWNGNTLTLTPSDELGFKTKYMVCVTGMDLAGNQVSKIWSFNTTILGEIKGMILDDKGAPLANATVTLNTGAHMITDENGSFLFENVTSGIYTLTVEKDGYDTFTLDLPVSPGQVSDTGTRNVSVQKDTGIDSNVMIIVALVIIIAIMTVCLLYMRRRPKTP